MDHVIFLPAYVSAFKVKTPPIALADDRIKMIKIALQGFSFFSVDDREIRKQKVSYTIDTVKEMLEEYTSLRLIVSQNVACEMEKWKDIDTLLQLVSLVVGHSDLKKDFYSIKNTLLKEKIIKNLLPIKNLDISSTYIRERIKKKLDCRHLTAKEVLDHIYHHKLYYMNI